MWSDTYGTCQTIASRLTIWNVYIKGLSTIFRQFPAFYCNRMRTIRSVTACNGFAGRSVKFLTEFSYLCGQPICMCRDTVWRLTDFWSFTSKNHATVMRDTVVEGSRISTTWGFLTSTDIAQHTGFNISPSSKCSCHVAAGIQSRDLRIKSWVP